MGYRLDSPDRHSRKKGTITDNIEKRYGKRRGKNGKEVSVMTGSLTNQEY